MRSAGSMVINKSEVAMYLFRKHYGESVLLHWIVFALCCVVVFAAIMICAGCAPVYGMGNAHALVEMKAQLADRLTGIEQANLKLAAKVDAQTVAMAGVNNTVSKVSSEVHAGRDANSGNTNATEIFTAQLQAQKETALAQIEMYKYEIKLQSRETLKLYGIIILLINALIWIMKKQANSAANARYWQIETVSRAEPEELPGIMCKKKEHDKNNSIACKVENLVTKVMPKKEV